MPAKLSPEERKRRHKEAAARCYQARREHYLAASQQYQAAHKAKYLAYGRAYKLAMYGLSPNGRALLLASQNYECGVCHVDLRTLPAKQVHIDHDHKTGKVRGILCARCNKGLGVFEDSISALSGAAAYLQRNADQQNAERTPVCSEI